MNDRAYPRRLLLITAVAGLFGAVLMFTGDMLLYGHFGSGAEFINRHKTVIAEAGTVRLYLAGALGPIAAIFYLIGAYHLYLRLQPSRAFVRILTSLAFAAMFVIAGAVHAVWAAYALVLRGVAHGQANTELETVMRSYLAFVYRLAEIVGYPSALLLFILVLMGRTSYPRWSAVLNPGLLMLASSLVVFLPAPIGAPIVGGLFNLTFVVFFALSLATTPRHQEYSTKNLRAE